MTTIYNTAVNAAGVPLRDIPVTISLSIADGLTPSIPSTDRIIHTSHTVYTDNMGYWSAGLTSNTDIEPAGTFYKIVESSETYYVDVPSGATPTFWVGDILAATPAWEV